mmetsp:Transcript_23439/g.51299  ORF Transcript_23439/g.51299 Transcript_23439/m.51299 type:complete len:210 (-) Transcript_23439:168-797(-)
MDKTRKSPTTTTTTTTTTRGNQINRVRLVFVCSLEFWCGAVRYGAIANTKIIVLDEAVGPVGFENNRHTRLHTIPEDSVSQCNARARREQRKDFLARGMHARTVPCRAVSLFGGYSPSVYVPTICRGISSLPYRAVPHHRGYTNGGVPNRNCGTLWLVDRPTDRRLCSIDSIVAKINQCLRGTSTREGRNEAHRHGIFGITYYLYITAK